MKTEIKILIEKYKTSINRLKALATSEQDDELTSEVSAGLEIYYEVIKDLKKLICEHSFKTLYAPERTVHYKCKKCGYTRTEFL